MQKIVCYTGPLSMFGMKVEIALHEKALDFERIEVPYNATTGYDPKHPDVVRVNPKRQVPVLVDRDLELFDSTQIFEYIEDAYSSPPLWPKSVCARALARQMEHRSDEVYFPHVIRLMGLQRNLSDPAAVAALAAAHAFHSDVDRLLADQQYLCGEYTYADIAFFMVHLFGERMGATLNPDATNLAAWRARVSARPAVRTVMDRFASYLRANNRTIPDFIVR